MADVKVIYWIKGAVPTSEERLAAREIGTRTFRNAAMLIDATVREECDAVAGEVPRGYEDVPVVKSREDVYALQNALMDYENTALKGDGGESGLGISPNELKARKSAVRSTKRPAPAAPANRDGRPTALQVASGERAPVAGPLAGPVTSAATGEADKPVPKPKAAARATPFDPPPTPSPAS